MCPLCATGSNDGPSRPPITLRARRRYEATLARTRSRMHREISARRRSQPLVVEADWVLATDRGHTRLLRDHAVVIDGAHIAEVRPAGRGGTDRRLRAPGTLLLPGFISGHTHVAGGTPTRGIFEGGRTYGRPLELVEELDADDLEAVTAHNLAELLRSGCTTQVEMSLSLRQAEAYVAVAERWGARGYPSAMVPGIGRLFDIWFRTDDAVLFESVPDSRREIEAALTFGRRHVGTGDDRIRAQMGVHATDTQTPETLEAFAAAAAELGNGLHLHLAQRPGETEAVQRLWGKRPAEWIDDFGFYDGPLLAAHLSGADLDRDPALLRDRGATYVHNPSAGGAGGATQPWPEFLGAGVRTNIGIDTHSNDHLENIKLAVLYGQARYELLAQNSPRPLTRPTIDDAIRAATADAADGLGRADLGRIAVGARADLVTVDVCGLFTGAGSTPPEPLHHLLYGNGGNVRDVVVDGDVKVRNGHLVIDDEVAVVRRGAAAVTRIWEQLEAEGWFAG